MNINTYPSEKGKTYEIDLQIHVLDCYLVIQVWPGASGPHVEKLLSTNPEYIKILLLGHIQFRCYCRSTISLYKHILPLELIVWIAHS